MNEIRWRGAERHAWLDACCVYTHQAGYMVLLLKLLLASRYDGILPTCYIASYPLYFTCYDHDKKKANEAS